MAPQPTASIPSSAATAVPRTIAPLSILAGALLPGTYFQGTVPPIVSFALGSGWQAYFNDADGAYLGNENGVDFGINRPPKVVDPETGASRDSPADIAQWLAASPAFASAEATKIRINGVDATLVDATASDQQTDLFAYASGNFHTVNKARYHFYVVPMDGPDLVLLFMGPAAKFESALPMVRSIVDSVVISGA